MEQVKKENETLESIDLKKIQKREKRKKSRVLELIRFVITGLIATAIDAVIFFVLMKYVFNNLATQGGENGWGGYVAWGISTTISFFISCIVNYFISRLWVYQNVDKNINTKTQKAFWGYVGLSAIGWLIGLSVQEAGVVLCNFLWSDLKLSTDFVKVSWVDLWNGAGLAFWAFVVIFVVKTLVTLIYNYLTRKHLIFKAPKKEDEAFAKLDPNQSMVVTVVPEEEQPKKRRKDKNKEDSKQVKTNLTTVSSFKKILHEEIENTFGKDQKRVSTLDATKIVREEIDNYNKVHGRSKGGSK